MTAWPIPPRALGITIQVAADCGVTACVPVCCATINSPTPTTAPPRIDGTMLPPRRAERIERATMSTPTPIAPRPTMPATVSYSAGPSTLTQPLTAHVSVETVTW